MSLSFVRSEQIFSTYINSQWVILSPDREHTIELNEVAGLIWEKIQTPSTLKQLVKLVCRKYEIDRQTALNDIQVLLKNYSDQKLIKAIKG